MCWGNDTSGRGISTYFLPIIKKNNLSLPICCCTTQAINYSGQIEIIRFRCLQHHVDVVLNRWHVVAVEEDSIITWYPEAVAEVKLELSDLFASQSPFVVVENRTVHMRLIHPSIHPSIMHPSIHQSSWKSWKTPYTKHQAGIFPYLLRSRAM